MTDEARVTTFREEMQLRDIVCVELVAGDEKEP